MEEQESKTTIPSSRKRQLEPIDPEQEREDERDSESGPPSPKVPATNNNFLDEIELHFQRSLANVKPSQRSPVPTTTATDGNHTHSAVNNQQTRDSPSPNQQSRLTPPTSSSSLTSSPRRHGIHSNKPLPPPLKLASPTSDSQSTVQSLYPHQQLPTIRPPSVTQHQTIILPTITTATRLSRQSPPSSMTGPSAPTIANGLPSGGASPPSVISYSSGGVAQIHALPTISTAALGSGSAGVYIASPQFLSSQQALHQALSNGGSSSPKRTATISGTSTGAAGGAAATIPVANNACGALAAVQLTPGGPLLALPSSVLQPSTTAAGNSGHNRSRGRTFLNLSSGGTIGGSVGTAGTGTSVAASGGGSYQIHAPSVTQPGSVHIIDLPIESSAGKSSPPTPLLATAPTLPKAPTVVNVSQIPNLVAINPSSPNSPSPGSNKSTPTVKVVGTGSPLLTTGIQSPIRVSSASAQTTPVATPTLITPQQLAANPSLMSVVDPSVSAQLLAAGNTGCNPVYLIPANSMPMVQQPFFIINPSTTTATDLTSIQQLQQANILASNPSLAGASLVSNPAAAAGGGYLLVSPGSAGTPANFSMPLVNLASTSSVNSSQPAIPNLIPTSPAITATTLKPTNKATILYSTTASSSGNATGGSGASSRPTAAKPPLINQSSTDSAPSPAHNDVMMTPASVDDHFAQALGPQWNKLKSHNNMQPQQC